MTPPDGVPAPPSARARNTRRPKADSSPDATIPPAALDAPSPTRKPLLSPRVFGVARAIAGLALIVGLAGGAAWGARQYIRTSTRFAVSEIVTTGGKHRSPQEIAGAAGITKGENVFRIDLDRARTRLLADPWVTEASLSRQLPGTVFVRVVEREAAGLLATAEGTYLVTREGEVIKQVEPGDPVDLHVVTGISLDDIAKDREGATRTIRRALDLASDYDHSPLAQRSPLQEVHVEKSEEMTLVVGKSAVAIRMGAAPYRRKIEQAVRVVAELDRRGAKPDAIMLDNEARPDRIVVRVR
jgi:cell division protein FtsQ